MSECLLKIENLFTERLYLQVASPDTDLLESGILDSMALVELLAALEQEFGIRVNVVDLDFEHFRSMASIAALVSAEERRRVA